MTHGVLSPWFHVPIYRLQEFSSLDLCRKITQLVRECLWSVFHIRIFKETTHTQHDVLLSI